MNRQMPIISTISFLLFNFSTYWNCSTLIHVMHEICQAKSLEQSLESLYYNMVSTLYSPVNPQEKESEEKAKENRNVSISVFRVISSRLKLLP